MCQVEEIEHPDEGEKVQACIFKVGDDCRQDVLALQVVCRPSSQNPCAALTSSVA